MSAHHEGDIVTARDGSKWRVVAVERTIVRAQHIGTVTDVLAWTVDDLGARFATVVTDDGETHGGVSLDSLEAVAS